MPPKMKFQEGKWFLQSCLRDKMIKKIDRSPLIRTLLNDYQDLTSSINVHKSSLRIVINLGLLWLFQGYGCFSQMVFYLMYFPPANM